MKYRSLRRTIATAFLAMAVFAGVCGGLLAILFAYTTEDHIFDRLLALEAAHLEGSIGQGESLPEPELPFSSYYQAGTLPAFLQAALEAEPGRREVFGEDGKHYHLRRVASASAGPAWIVLEVQDYLAVRPVLTGITLVLALAILAITLIAAIAGAYVAHRVTGPLRSLAAEVSALQPENLPTEWQRRYPADEVGRLADTLREAFRRIHRFIDREQRFTEDASHELRTPLTVIESSVAMLARSRDADQAEALIGRIRSAAMAMHLSVDGLLALAREDRPERSVERTAVLPIVERSVVNHASLLDGKAVHLSVAVDPDWRVAGDPAALQVLIANLVSNAFRYTEEGTVRIERDGNDLLVIDSGVGIDPALKPEVTKHAVKSSDSPGLGLGLSIVERLCRRYGWRFELSSSPHGTTAALRLGA